MSNLNAASAHVTTDELLAITKSTRDTLYKWVANRLLPRPRIETGANGRQFAAWPADALERVRFIVKWEHDGFPIAEIAIFIKERWPPR